MPRDSELESARREASDCPTAWFAMLERARDTRDCELAARALRELDRLGVKVSYTPTHPNFFRKGVNHVR